jgi:hypothetical protein
VVVAKTPTSPATQQTRRGIEVWKLRDEQGRIHSCELRDDSAVGAGWDVQFLTKR